MFGRLFHQSSRSSNHSSGYSGGGGNTSPDSSHRDYSNDVVSGEEEKVEEDVPPPPPPTPLVRTKDGKTVVRLYIEILNCDHLGPDYDEQGRKIKDDPQYKIYVKVKLGWGLDDKTIPVNIHKTKIVDQTRAVLTSRDPIFDPDLHCSGFCVDGLTQEELGKGLLLKVKDANNKKDAVLGFALVQADSLLWDAAGLVGDSSASHTYHEELDHTLELELIHPTHMVTGLSGKIHLYCRPATDQDIDRCRSNGWGYFVPYERDISDETESAQQQQQPNARSTTPPMIQETENHDNDIMMGSTA